MNVSDTFALIDTCVLLKPRVSDVLMDLRAEEVFSLHWTESIDLEHLRNLPRIANTTRTRAATRLAAMKQRCPEWRIDVLGKDLEAVPDRVHIGDRHVAAAALAVKHGLEDAREEGWLDGAQPEALRVFLVTDNLKHFAPEAMSLLGVKVTRAGEFLDEVFGAEPDASFRAVLQSVKDLRNPPYTLAELLDSLRKQGATHLASSMASLLGIPAVRATSRGIA